MNQDKNHIPFAESPFYIWSGTKFGKIILHSCFWVCYLIYLFSDLLGKTQADCDIFCHLLDNSVYLLCTMTGVYINAYFFVPLFLYRRKFILYLLCLICIALITSTIKLYVFNYILDAGDVQTEGFLLILVYWFCKDIFEIAAISSIKIASDWIITANQLRQKEKQELEAEFRFLKAQVNPHFIFNTLNNIYVLINKNSPKASEAIISLSNILRYRIYESGEIGNTIENEIQCIKDLIELEKLRLESDVKIEFFINKFAKNHPIEPLLFIPFVENAFKHFRANKEGKWIKINFNITESQIEFTCVNSKTLIIEKNLTGHGIGIKNVSNRLKLMYPKNHVLTINDSEEIYSIHLIISI